MKKNLLFFALIFGINCWAQEYHPLLDCTDRKEASWSLLGFSTYWYNDIGDTTINNIVYRKWQFNSETESRLGVLIREDTLERKVYTYDLWNEKEDLLYDFSLYFKEEYVLPNGITYIVSDIDSIETCQGMRARWHFDGPGPGFVVVESIGSLEGLLSPYYANISDPVGSTLCIFNQCEKIFGDDCVPHERWHNESIYQNYTICQGEVVFMGDTIFTNAGSHEYFSQGTEQECPTTYFIEIEIVQDDTTIVNLEYCQGSSVEYNGQIYDSEGVYFFTSSNSSGCDSTIQLDVREIGLDTTYLTVESCDSYNYQDEQLQESGQYEFLISSPSVCDTVLILNLVINTSIEQFISPEFCEGQSIVFGDVVIYDDTPTEIYLTNMAGCDSVLNINPILYNAVTVEESIDLCEGDFVEVDGQVIADMGTYTFNYTSDNGCDSTYILNITIVPSSDPNCVNSSDQLLEDMISVYYSQAHIHIQTEHTLSQVIVYDISGRVLTTSNSNKSVSFEPNTSGLYVVSVLTDDGHRINKKLFIQ